MTSRRTSRATKPRWPAAKSKRAANARATGRARATGTTSGAGVSGKKGAQQATGKAASRLIDARIRELGGWRGETLARMRTLILRAVPAMTEEWKWNNPVWSHDGIVCTGEAYKNAVKLTFARGASVPDPSRLFNSSLEGNTRRAIDIREGEKLDARAFKTLVKAAVALNGAQVKRATSRASGPKPVSERKRGKAALLSGGNPQIAKAEGDASVQAYIAAMPDWKRSVGKRLDALIVRTVPDVRKAVKWNSPFYGVEGRGWFLSFHVFARYVKVTFFNGASLRPLPPGGTSRSGDSRWIDVHEGGFDEAQMAAWVKQAAALPGWDPSKRS